MKYLALVALLLITLLGTAEAKQEIVLSTVDEGSQKVTVVKYIRSMECYASSAELKCYEKKVVGDTIVSDNYVGSQHLTGEAYDKFLDSKNISFAELVAVYQALEAAANTPEPQLEEK